MMFGTWLAVAYAVPRQWLPTVCAKTSCRPKPTTRATTVIAAMRAAARPIPRPAWRSGPASVTEAGGPVTTALRPPWCLPPGIPRAAGRRAPGPERPERARRPSMSSHRRAGVRSITAVKLTTSLAAVRPVIAASNASLAGRDRLAAAATPSRAPSALAPASPSIARSPRSSGSSAIAAPSGAATVSRAPGPGSGSSAAPGPAAAPGPMAAPSLAIVPGPADVPGPVAAPWRAGPRRAPAARSAPLASATLSARPGRRSKRFSRLAPPATSPALMATSAGPPPSSAADARPVAPIPPSLTAPVVTSPLASAPRCPRNPRLLPLPARSSYPPNAAAPVPAIASAARTRGSRPGPSADTATLPTVRAGPSSRVSCSPRWLVLVQVPAPPGGLRVKTE